MPEVREEEEGGGCEMRVYALYARGPHEGDGAWGLEREKLQNIRLFRSKEAAEVKLARLSREYPHQHWHFLVTEYVVKDGEDVPLDAVYEVMEDEKD